MTDDDHDHDHDHDHDDHSELEPMDARVRALEAVLVAKGYVKPETLDEIVDFYETKIGPRIGAAVVARAWTDSAFKEWLLTDPREAVGSMNVHGRQVQHLKVLENTPSIHHVVVCTLCSCYPWPLLGLPPGWYKSKEYRARVVIEPRAVLAEFGLELPADTEVRVRDSIAENRYLVLPMRPEGTEGWSADDLARLVTRNSMIGTGLPHPPGAIGGGKHVGP